MKLNFNFQSNLNTRIQTVWTNRNRLLDRPRFPLCCCSSSEILTSKLQLKYVEGWEKPSTGGFLTEAATVERRMERIWIKLHTYLYKIQTDFKVKEEHNLILLPEERKYTKTWKKIGKKEALEMNRSDIPKKLNENLKDGHKIIT